VKHSSRTRVAVVTVYVTLVDAEVDSVAETVLVNVEVLVVVADVAAVVLNDEDTDVDTETVKELVAVDVSVETMERVLVVVAVLEAVVLAQLWAGVVAFLEGVDGEGRVRDIAVPAGAEEEGRLGVQIRLVRRPAAEVDVEPEELAEHPDVFCSAS